jgi:hypothetical protein
MAVHHDRNTQVVPYVEEIHLGERANTRPETIRFLIAGRHRQALARVARYQIFHTAGQPTLPSLVVLKRTRPPAILRILARHTLEEESDVSA